MIDAKGLFLEEARKPRRGISLADWQWAAEPYACAPDIAIGPRGEAVVTSNVLPVLWKIDLETLAVTMHRLQLDADSDKDVGFSGLAYSAREGAYFAVSELHGSLWRIDPMLRRAQKFPPAHPCAAPAPCRFHVRNGRAASRSSACTARPNPGSSTSHRINDRLMSRGPVVAAHSPRAEASIESALEVFQVFLKIGALGFGVAAIWGLIQAEVQERRKWLTKERFLEGLAVVQALPGATALQMHLHRLPACGVLGRCPRGHAFMLPAFAVMLALAALHSAYGALPFMRDAFYGIGPVVLGIFAAAVWRLGGSAVKDWFSVLLALAAVAAFLLSPIGPAGVFLLAGCIGVAVHHSRKAGLIAAAVVLLLSWAERFAESILPAVASGLAGSAGLWDIGVFFFKVGAVTFGAASPSSPSSRIRS